MTTQYSYEKQLIKDFIRWASDNYRCALVAFPDEFSSNQFINYNFVNNGQLIEEFVNDIQRKTCTPRQRTKEASQGIRE